MKFHILSTVGLALVLTFASCKKNDLQESNLNVVEENSEMPVANSDWTTVSSWESDEQEGFTVYHVNITDPEITEEIAGNGLVMVYKSNGATIQTLPFEDKQDNSSNYWYYQITNGTIMITVDSYGQASIPSTEEFKYIILNIDQLKSLESKGHTRGQLMQMTYDAATSITQ